MKNTNTNNIHKKNVIINPNTTLSDAAAHMQNMTRLPKTASKLPQDISLHDLLTILGDVEKAETRPTSKALRERKLGDGSVEQVAPLAEAMGGECKVFSNGYAVYTNGIGATVLWLQDCRTFTYQFDELNQKEKEYLPQRSEIGEDVMGSQPWFMAVMLCGDHQVVRNAMNRTGSRMDKNKSVSLDEIAEKEEVVWLPGCRFDNSESAYIRKETMQEQLTKLTDRQREVFVLYHQYGYSQRKIAEMLGISQQAVDCRLTGAESKVRMKSILF